MTVQVVKPNGNMLKPICRLLYCLVFFFHFFPFLFYIFFFCTEMLFKSLYDERWTELVYDGSSPFFRSYLLQNRRKRKYDWSIFDKQLKSKKLPWMNSTVWVGCKVIPRKNATFFFCCFYFPWEMYRRHVYNMFLCV